MSLLALDDIHTAYGLSRVLFGISLEVETGECVSLADIPAVGSSSSRTEGSLASAMPSSSCF